MLVASNDDNDSVRVLVVGHVRVYREGLMSALRADDRLEVVGAADDYQTTLIQVSEHRPDVAVIDMATPDAFAIIAGLRMSAFPPKVVAFAVEEQDAQIIGCVEAGACAYVTSDASTETLCAAIEGAARDEIVCPPKITALLVRRLASRAAATPPPVDDRALTRREQQVLRLLRDGLANKEIAESLNIAEATVKHHVHNLLEKLDATTRSQAVARLSTLRPMVAFHPFQRSRL